MTLHVDQISLSDDFQLQGKKTTSWQTLNVWSILPTFTRKKWSNVGTVEYSLYRVSGTSGFSFHSTTHTKSQQMWIYQYLGGGNSKCFFMFTPIWGKFPFWLIPDILLRLWGSGTLQRKNPRGRRSWSIGRGTSTAPNSRSNDRVIFCCL